MTSLNVGAPQQIDPTQPEDATFSAVVEPAPVHEEVILIFRSDPSGANVEVVSFQLP